jgi:hypothetical protein
MTDRRGATAFVLIAVLAVSACGDDDDSGASATTSINAVSAAASLPQGADPVTLDPSEFVATIDHPFWPLRPGARWVYRETDEEGNESQVVVEVTDESKAILGIRATVAHDVVSENGTVVEDTWDWYAQDAKGNLWYLGEDTKEYENGQMTSTEGSWTAGVDGAQPGIILPADPKVSMTYRQEYLEGKAEDAGEILSLDEKATVPFGSFDQLLMTRDYTPLEPDAEEHKYYARGVGPVLTVSVRGSGREELLEYQAGS